MRETRSYGSARGVRRNPYPYRDSPPPLPVRSTAKNPFLGKRTPGGQKLTTHRVRFAHSQLRIRTRNRQPHRAANRAGIRAQIGHPIRAGIGQGFGIEPT